jgi:hypothetical protein
LKLQNNFALYKDEQRKLHSFYLSRDCDLRGRMTAKEGPSSFTLVSENISWRFVRLDLKSCFEVHLAMYEVDCYW